MSPCVLPLVCGWLDGGLTFAEDFTRRGLDVFIGVTPVAKYFIAHQSRHLLPQMRQPLKTLDDHHQILGGSRPAIVVFDAGLG